MREEFLAGEPAPGEEALEVGLRPRRLSEFVGQREVKDHLSILLEAARMRGQAADHVLLAGPPGLGLQQVVHEDGGGRQVAQDIMHPGPDPFRQPQITLQRGSEQNPIQTAVQGENVPVRGFIGIVGRQRLR